MNEKGCNNRREFLVKSTVTAGGLILSLAGASAVSANSADGEVSVKIDDKSPLNKVGGFQVVESPGGKVIVVHTETGFKAYSAVCTHKGATLSYDEKTKLLTCPSHNSRFDADGKNAGGPSKTPLPVYGAENVVMVKIK